MTTPTLPISLDVRRTALHRNFFERYADAQTADEVVSAVDAETIDAPALMTSSDCATLGYSGWSYWLLYLKGFLAYREQGSLEPSNVYLRYFLDHYLPGAYDPGLRNQVSDEQGASQRVVARFADTQRMLAGRKAPRGLEPVRVLASTRRDDDLHDVYDAASGVAVKARLVDGWHRLFAARVGGVSALPAVVCVDEKTWNSVP